MPKEKLTPQQRAAKMAYAPESFETPERRQEANFIVERWRRTAFLSSKDTTP